MNETRTILESSVNRLFADRLDWDALTRIEESGWPAELWAEVTEQGFHLVLADEDAGGMAADWSDAYVVLRACGRYAVPLPLAEASVAQWLARQAGATLPEGVPGLVLEGAGVAADTLSLANSTVPWGQRADFLVAAVGAELIVAGKDGLEVDAASNIGLDPRDRLNGAVAIRARHPLPLPGDALQFLGALMRAAQIAGGAAACLDLAVGYASEREQFGRPLAAFQAIQHHLADLAGAVASVDAMVLAACAALDQRGLAASGRDARMEIAAAKCRASEAVERITRLAHQVHGAIGFTYEYGLHFVTRRLWAWRAECGSASAWGEYLGGVACEVGGDGIWPAITA